MEKKQLQSILNTVNILKKLEQYSINENDIVNYGYRKYTQLVYCLINKCLTEFESEINVVNNLYKISSLYDKMEIYFIFNEKNLSKIFLSIKDDDVEILINLNINEINFYFRYINNEYLIVNFNKKKNINDVIYGDEKKKQKEIKTNFYDLSEIINDLKIHEIQDYYKSLEEFIKCLIKIKEILEK